MPIEGSAGTLDIENATLRSNAIAVLTNLVTGNDRVRESGAPALEVYGDPSNGGNEARLEMVSNTATVSSSAFTRLTSNAGVLSIKTGTDASDNGTITFGGFANERMRIGSDGKVGIGTDSPEVPLNVVGNNALSGTPNNTIASFRATTAVPGTNDAGVVIGSINGNAPYIADVSSASVGLSFYTQNNHRMRILANGNVGIGDSDPDSILHVQSDVQSGAGGPIKKTSATASTSGFNYILNGPRPGTTDQGAVFFINGSSRTLDGDTNTLTIRNDSGSVDIGSRSETLVSSHNTVPEPYNANQKNVDIMLNNGSIWMSPYTGRHRSLGTGTGDWNQYIGKHYLGRILTGIQIENKSTNSTGGTGYYSNLLHFRAHDHGIYGGDESDITMTVRGDKVGVRTQTPGYTLEVNGSLFYSSGGLNGSDDRIKYNEENITNALDIIGKLKPQKYEKIMAFPSDAKGTWIPTDENWETVKNAETKPWEGFTYGNEFGFIAQDVRNIPEVSFLVSGSENKMSDENISPDEYHKLPEEEQSNYTQKFIYESNAITLQEYTSLTLENRENYTELYSKRVETQTPLGLNYQGIFVVAVKAIQELKSENEDLQAEKVKVATLETQVADLLARVQTLEGA
jgi:hypothetical protein